MAKPQLEDGHTQIANEILERLAQLYLTPNQWQIIVFILRKTYGFKKKTDHIANWQIATGTGLNKHVVARALRTLNDRNIIRRNGKITGFQKDWELWLLPKQTTIGLKLSEQTTNESYQNRQPELPKQTTELPKQTTKVTSPRITQKKKETIQKKLYKRKGEFSNVLLSDDEYQKLMDRFGDKETERIIENLSIGIQSKGYKYKDHYATILNWVRREREKGGQGGTNGKNPQQAEAREADRTERLRRSIHPKFQV